MKDKSPVLAISTVLVLILVAVFVPFEGCQGKDKLTYDVETGTTTLNGKELSADETIDYFEDESHLDSQVVVIYSEEKNKTMTVREFTEAVEAIARSLQYYDKPESDETLPSTGNEDLFDPFEPGKSEPVGMRRRSE